MVKAHLTSQGRPIYFIGLSEENVRRLREGKPIVFAASELFPLPGAGSVVIHYGKTEDAIQAELERTFGVGVKSDPRKERS